MRRFRLYIIACGIEVHSSWADEREGKGWIECNIAESEKQQAFELFKGHAEEY